MSDTEKKKKKGVITLSSLDPDNTEAIVAAITENRVVSQNTADAEIQIEPPKNQVQALAEALKERPDESFYQAINFLLEANITLRVLTVMLTVLYDLNDTGDVARSFLGLAASIIFYVMMQRVFGSERRAIAGRHNEQRDRLERLQLAVSEGLGYTDEQKAAAQADHEQARKLTTLEGATYITFSTIEKFSNLLVMVMIIGMTTGLVTRFGEIVDFLTQETGFISLIVLIPLILHYGKDYIRNRGAARITRHIERQLLGEGYHQNKDKNDAFAHLQDPADAEQRQVMGLTHSDDTYVEATHDQDRDTSDYDQFINDNNHYLQG